MPNANMIDLYYQDNMSDKQHAIDFAMLWRNGIFCIAHKASQGLHFRDPLCASRRKQCLAAAPNMLWIYYHFLDSSDADGQADNFLGAVAESGQIMPYALAADYEKNAGNTAALHQLQTFVTRTDATTPGQLTLIYSGDLIRESLQPIAGGHKNPDMIGAEDFMRRHPLWLAEYGPRENIPWPWNTAAPNEPAAPGASIWQFDDHGKFAAAIGPVDVNNYAGTREQMAAALFGAVAPATA
jgi:GH25 family lysozyme M1 (1,4-beta-N-acetylmuramidase)